MSNQSSDAKNAQTEREPSGFQKFIETIVGITEDLIKPAQAKELLPTEFNPEKELADIEEQIILAENNVAEENTGKFINNDGEVSDGGSQLGLARTYHEAKGLSSKQVSSKQVNADFQHENSKNSETKTEILFAPSPVIVKNYETFSANTSGSTSGSTTTPDTGSTKGANNNAKGKAELTSDDIAIVEDFFDAMKNNDNKDEIASSNDTIVVNDLLDDANNNSKDERIAIETSPALNENDELAPSSDTIASPDTDSVSAPSDNAKGKAEFVSDDADIVDDFFNAVNNNNGKDESIVIESFPNEPNNNGESSNTSIEPTPKVDVAVQPSSGIVKSFLKIPANIFSFFKAPVPSDNAKSKAEIISDDTVIVDDFFGAVNNNQDASSNNDDASLEVANGEAKIELPSSDTIIVKDTSAPKVDNVEQPGFLKSWTTSAFQLPGNILGLVKAPANKAELDSNNDDVVSDFLNQANENDSSNTIVPSENIQGKAEIISDDTVIVDDFFGAVNNNQDASSNNDDASLEVANGEAKIDSTPKVDAIIVQPSSGFISSALRVPARVLSLFKAPANKAELDSNSDDVVSDFLNKANENDSASSVASPDIDNTNVPSENDKGKAEIISDDSATVDDFFGAASNNKDESILIKSFPNEALESANIVNLDDFINEEAEPTSRDTATVDDFFDAVNNNQDASSNNDDASLEVSNDEAKIELASSDTIIVKDTSAPEVDNVEQPGFVKSWVTSAFQLPGNILGLVKAPANKAELDSSSDDAVVSDFLNQANENDSSNTIVPSENANGKAEIISDDSAIVDDFFGAASNNKDESILIKSFPNEALESANIVNLDDFINEEAEPTSRDTATVDDFFGAVNINQDASSNNDDASLEVSNDEAKIEPTSSDTIIVKDTSAPKVDNVGQPGFIKSWATSALQLPARALGLVKAPANKAELDSSSDDVVSDFLNQANENDSASSVASQEIDNTNVPSENTKGKAELTSDEIAIVEDFLHAASNNKDESILIKSFPNEALESANIANLDDFINEEAELTSRDTAIVDDFFGAVNNNQDASSNTDDASLEVSNGEAKVELTSSDTIIAKDTSAPEVDNVEQPGLVKSFATSAFQLPGNILGLVKAPANKAELDSSSDDVVSDFLNQANENDSSSSVASPDSSDTTIVDDFFDKVNENDSKDANSNVLFSIDNSDSTLPAASISDTIVGGPSTEARGNDNSSPLELSDVLHDQKDTLEFGRAFEDATQAHENTLIGSSSSSSSVVADSSSEYSSIAAPTHQPLPQHEDTSSACAIM